MAGGPGLTGLPEDPNWPTASAWLAGDHEAASIATMEIIGAPVRLGSISGGRFDLAPEAIRQAAGRFSPFDSRDASTRYDLRRIAAEDAGNVDVADLAPEEAFESLVRAVRVGLEESDVEVVLGGDNSVTRPGVHAVAASLDRAGLLTLDAHHDLRDTGGGLTNGNPVRALIEDGLPGANIVQVGIQPFANSRAYTEVARDAGITVVTVDQVRGRGIEPVIQEVLDVLAGQVDAIYVDLDLDVLDRAFAPASPGSRPGGLASWELLTGARLCGAHPKVRMLDIVELDPTKDVADITVLTAAACVLSFAAGVAARLGGREGG